jgi:hypothetical protein
MLPSWNQAWKASIIPALLLSPAAVAQIKGAWVDPPADLSASQAQDPDLGLKTPATSSPSQVIPPPSPEVIVPQAGEPRSAVTAAQSTPKDRASGFSSMELAPRSRVLPPQTVPRSQSAQPAREIAPTSPPPFYVTQRAPAAARANSREEDARNLAVSYLSLWSASNQRTLQTTPAFYSSGVVFHGRSMSVGALLAEKRRFVQRWPNRDYRYRPGSMNVVCESNRKSCIVRSTFDFDAANVRLGRRSRGVGTHELVVTFAGDRPVIVSENSQVLRRGSTR